MKQRLRCLVGRSSPGPLRRRCADFVASAAAPAHIVCAMTRRSNPTRTSQRVAALQAYTDRHVTDGREFRCPREATCRASATTSSRTGLLLPDVSFYRGQLSHVGEHYDTVEGDVPWRVLVLGMETGRAREFVTLNQRRDEQQPVVELDPTSRKPHMKGTASALRLAFGGRPGLDHAGEELAFVNVSEPVHVMNAYALANVRLCSAVTTGTTSSRGSARMTENCWPHLEATVRILEPTLCILQSGPARRQLNGIIHEVETITEHLEHVTIAGVRLYLASFVHPYQQGNNSHLNWGRSTSTPYLDDVVTPTIELARKLALTPPGGGVGPTRLVAASNAGLGADDKADGAAAVVDN